MVRTAWRYLYILAVLSMILGAHLGVSAQTISAQEILNMKISENEKTAIGNRIDEMLRLLREEKYAAAYQFFGGSNWDTENEFLDDIRKRIKHLRAGDSGWHMVEKFYVEGYFVMNDRRKHESVFVDGCLIVRMHAGIKSYSGSVKAYRKGTTTWYFESLPIINPDAIAGGGPISCSPPTPSSK